MYNIGQGENLLSAGKVAYPTYLDCAERECSYTKPDTKKRPVNIPLGTYADPYDESGYVEHYEPQTQQTRAGEISDGAILIIMICLLVGFSICTYIAFSKKIGN